LARVLVLKFRPVLSRASKTLGTTIFAELFFCANYPSLAF
jgi:hypothetical protein